MIPNSKILVIDSDPAIQRLLTILLERERCRVICANSSAEGLSKAVTSTPDLVILELKLNRSDGVSVLKALRRHSRAPVMILSARSNVGEIVKALDEGACDFVVKPFNGAEMAARVRLQLRCKRTAGANIFISENQSNAPAPREIMVNGLKLELTAKEEAVLQILARHPGALVTIHDILNAIWGNDGAAQLHELRVYITRLRRKLEACGAANLIESESNVGYSLSIGMGRDVSDVVGESW